jgi:hypothetical protein
VKAAGKFLKRRALSLFFLRKIRQSTMRTNSDSFRSGEIRILDSRAISNAPLRSTRRIENCDAVISVYDEAGNVIDTHEHTGDSKSGEPGGSDLRLPKPWLSLCLGRPH